VKLGAIGDDFTGSSDLGLTLAAGGMATVQYVGTPKGPAAASVEAGIVALKTRSVPVAEAVAKSLEALDWLRAQGCTQFLFKYCSTFDSTPQGNIGPVIDALVAALGTDAPVIVCPAFPATGRSLYQGHLFVGDRLLSESGMQNHPLTPMTDPDLRRWLRPQTTLGVGHVPLSAVRAGQARAVLEAEARGGAQLVVCDAVEDADLLRLGEAASGLPLVTGGSGIALGLPALHGARPETAQAWHGEAGACLCLSGSCSTATRGQIAAHVAAGGAALRLDVGEVVEGVVTAGGLLDWASAQATLPLVYSSDDPAQVRAVQARYGQTVAAEAIEELFAAVAVEAVARGFGRIVTAGGETSGAVVEALGAEALEIGPMIDPGVPVVRLSGRPLVLALKSGNFGAEDFFAKAARCLADGAA
jgi:uncharacterized protein YgbK (DUF1537 family)